jgi:hypothetical protein
MEPMRLNHQEYLKQENDKQHKKAGAHAAFDRIFCLAIQEKTGAEA